MADLSLQTVSARAIPALSDPDMTMNVAWSLWLAARNAIDGLPDDLAQEELSEIEIPFMTICRDAEDVILKSVPRTPAAAAIKLKAALGHRLVSIEDDAALRQGDMGSIDFEGLELGEQLIVSTVQALEAMMIDRSSSDSDGTDIRLTFGQAHASYLSALAEAQRIKVETMDPANLAVERGELQVDVAWAAEKAYGVADSEYLDAADRLLRTPAPDASALLVKFDVICDADLTDSRDIMPEILVALRDDVVRLIPAKPEAGS